MRIFASGVGAALYAILWQRRQVFYYERYGEFLSTFTIKSNAFAYQVLPESLSKPEKIVKLNKILDQQSTAFALDDCFMMMSWILTGLIVALIITFFHRKRIEFR